MAKDNKDKKGSAASKPAEKKSSSKKPPVAPVTNSTPSDAPTIAPISEEVNHEGNVNEAPLAPVVAEVPAEAPPAEAPVTETAPVLTTHEEQLEKMIDKWWNSRNRPTEVSNFELSRDIHMDGFKAHGETIVGKFKFKRSYAGANWEITVTE
jgi:cell pole-organizing protein PopZ